VRGNTAKRIVQLKTRIAGLKTANELTPQKDSRPTSDVTQVPGTRFHSDSPLKPWVARNRKPKISARKNTRVAGFQYKPRKPEDSLLHKIVAENLSTFLRDIRSKPEGNGLPSFVIKELEKFIDCGIIRKGLALFKCYKCGRPKVLAFSCKGRGFCPSCGGKRMTMQAAHLVDNVIGLVPTRQWVLSLPFSLRYKLAYDHKLHREVTKIFTSIVSDYYQKQAENNSVIGGYTGAVTFLQRAGGSINLNPHNHCMFVDGVFERFEDDDGTPSVRFHPAKKPTDLQIAVLVSEIRHQVICLMRDKGLFDNEYDSLAEESPLLAACYQASLQNRIALGERVGQRVERLADLLRIEKDLNRVERRGKLHAHYDGFDLHAKQRIHQNDREQLERTLRYCARPPLSEDRLCVLENGKIRLQLKTPWKDGTQAIALTPQELLEKLAVLVPKPGANQLLYHGVFAPNSKYRASVIRYGRKPESESIAEASSPKQLTLPLISESISTVQTKATQASRPSKWSELMQRAFKCDVLACDCGGRLRFIDCYCERKKIDETLRSLGMSEADVESSQERAPPKPRDDGPLFRLTK